MSALWFVLEIDFVRGLFIVRSSKFENKDTNGKGRLGIEYRLEIEVRGQQFWKLPACDRWVILVGIERSLHFTNG